MWVHTVVGARAFLARSRSSLCAYDCPGSQAGVGCASRVGSGPPGQTDGRSRMRNLVLALALLLSSAPLFVCFGARAQDSAPTGEAQVSDEVRKEASARFRRGVELFQEGAFRAALVEFQRAYDIAPDFRLLYNIGQAQVQVQDYLGANRSYERYLADGGSDVDPARREEVETALTALRERVARLVIRVDKDGADVFVDDQRVGTSPMSATVAVNLGRHRVYARLADGAAGEKVVDVAGGDLTEVDLVIVEVPPSPVASGPSATEDAPISSMRRGAIASWAAAGAFIAGAVVTGVMTGSKSDDLDAALDVKPPKGEANGKKIDDLRGSADTLALTTDILGGAAIALAVTGTILWFMGDSPDPDRAMAKRRITVGISAHAISVGSRF
jgi:hypothetical protein